MLAQINKRRKRPEANETKQNKTWPQFLGREGEKKTWVKKNCNESLAAAPNTSRIERERERKREPSSRKRGKVGENTSITAASRSFVNASNNSFRVSSLTWRKREVCNLGWCPDHFSSFPKQRLMTIPVLLWDQLVNGHIHTAKDRETET